MKSLWKTLNELFGVLPKGAKNFYLLYTVLTGLLAILDSFALALIVVVTTPLATGKGMNLPVVGEVPESATPILVLVICVLFVLKGVFALVLHRKATRRFAHYELDVGDRLFSTYLHSSWEQRAQLSTAEVTRIVDTAMANANLGFLLQLSMIPGNAMTFVAMMVVLVIAQPVTALIALVYLLTIALLMNRFVSRAAKRAGETNRNMVYRIATIMTEMIDALERSHASRQTRRDRSSRFQRPRCRNRCWAGHGLLESGAKVRVRDCFDRRCVARRRGRLSARWARRCDGRSGPLRGDRVSGDPCAERHPVLPLFRFIKRGLRARRDPRA